MTTAVARDLSLPPKPALRSAPVAVDVRHVTKSFQVRRPFPEVLRHPFARKWARALNDLSCEVRQGEFFGFLGANGAGKTTLFKILATLISPDEGTITIDGLDVTKNAADVRRVLAPVIADERSLRWRLSARENLRLYAVLYNIPESRLNARVDEVLATVGLDPSDRKLVGRFSSGMRQRLLIARALIPAPRILLLDEPTRSLDPVSARALRSFLREDLCRALGCTVLLATHTSEEAFDLCDRVAVLDQGRPVAIGATDQLALRVGHDRYRLWTRTPDAALELLASHGLARDVALRGIDDDGWAQLELEVPGSLEGAAGVLRFLTERGVVTARFERMGSSLGELMQSLTGQAVGGVRA